MQTCTHIYDDYVQAIKIDKWLEMQLHVYVFTH